MMHEGNRAARARMGQGGITLIELLVTVAILVILASVAVPSYMEYFAQARRADAQAALQELAQFLERNYTTNNRYDQDGDPDGDGNPATVLPFTTAPHDGGTVAYNLSATYANANSYTLSATPTGSMTGDSCGTLTLTHTGTRGAGGAVSECWKQ